MKIIVTGAAGFIGRAVCEQLCKQGHDVYGIDNMNDYYIVSLKEARLATLSCLTNFSFKKINISDYSVLDAFFSEIQPEKVIHLAAQAGVRYSLVNPHAYANSNLIGMSNILISSQKNKVSHLLYASSSSIYGQNTTVPFSEDDRTDQPISFYAATKKANEGMAYSYASLYKIPITGLRFFTVYGPWGRPDMAPWLFTEAIEQGKKIRVFNHGKLQRDFTYIDDIVDGVIRVMNIIPNAEHGHIPHELYNIGNNQPVELMEFIQTLESLLGKEAIKEFVDMQEGDVPITFANIKKLHDAVGFTPTTSLQHGLEKFVSWYLDYQKILKNPNK